MPVGEIARAFDISQHHLVKVVQRLRDMGLVRVERGVHGGVVLAVDPAHVSVGDVVRQLESEPVLACVGASHSDCAIHKPCQLRRALARAQEAFLSVLDEASLQEMARPGAPIRRALGIVA